MEDINNYKDTMEDDWLDFKNEVKENYITIPKHMGLNQAEILFKYYYIMRRSGFDAAIGFAQKYCDSRQLATTYLWPPQCLLENQCTVFCKCYNKYPSCSPIAITNWIKEEKFFRPIIPTDY